MRIIICISRLQKRPIGSTYNLTSVWPEYTGKGVLVAVVDDGVDGNHRELSANYVMFVFNFVFFFVIYITQSFKTALTV